MEATVSTLHSRVLLMAHVLMFGQDMWCRLAWFQLMYGRQLKIVVHIMWKCPPQNNVFCSCLVMEQCLSRYLAHKLCRREVILVTTNTYRRILPIRTCLICTFGLFVLSYVNPNRRKCLVIHTWSFAAVHMNILRPNSALTSSPHHVALTLLKPLKKILHTARSKFASFKQCFLSLSAR